MASVPRTSLGPAVGNQVFLLCQTDGCPRWTTAIIQSEEPFAVEVDVSWGCDLREGAELVLIHESARTVYKAECRIRSSKQEGRTAVLAFEAFEWHLAESRDHERYWVDAPSMVRSIADAGDGARMIEQLALTKNISAGGALVKLGYGVKVGDLVEFRMNLSHGRSMHAMGLVAHSNETGTTVGLSFVDFVGHSRRDLIEFLGRQAA